MMFRRKQPAGFSIICAYNDREKLERMLIASLRDQTAPHELLLIDNCSGHFRNPAAILNETARGARFEYLMFAHQDVVLGSPRWLEEAGQSIRWLWRFGAAGVAGRNAKRMVSNLTHGHPPRPACEHRLVRPVRVQTLDGCLMIVRRDLFMAQGFDENFAGGWYLYIANYCLDLARRGRSVHVLPQELYHESMGPSDPALYESAKAGLLDRHRDQVKAVYTTMGVWKT